MFTVLVILAVFLQVAIAIGVYLRRKGGHTNTIFMFLSLALAGWALANYIAITIPQNNTALYAIRTVISFVVIQNTLFYFFAKNFPNKKLSHVSRFSKFVVVYAFLVVILTQSPYLFSSVSIENGSANPNPAPPIVFFVLHALLTISLGLASLAGLYRKSVGQQKRQLRYVIFASTVVMLILPITNFVLTLGLHTTEFVRFSPFYTLAFGGFITYAIVAQKLFDIRAAVARSVAYLFIVATMTIVYGIALFGVVNVLFQGPEHEFLRQLLSVVLVTPLALSFQYIKQFFDRITNKLFYRDNYDLQEVFDRIGNVVVAEIDLHKILGSTRTVLSGALKSSFIEYILFKGDEPYLEAHGHSRLNHSLSEISAHMKDQHKELLVADELSSTSMIHKDFFTSGVALSLRLKTQHQTVGYILFGDKRSGDVYSAQDKKLLLIVANELAITIQNALRFEEIENFNATLQQKVIESTNQLRRSNDKLKSLDEAKDEFISLASHQLRTPLTSIKGYISMLLEGDAGDPLNPLEEKFLRQSFVSSQRMVGLIADLLNLSRLKTGKFVLEPKPCNFANVIEEEISQLVETAASRNLELIFEKPPQFSTLMLDETKIRQVAMNFIDNAIYYTPAGGKIVVGLKETVQSLEFTVTDDGIGVPKNIQHNLFSKFYRADNAKKARPDGTGLGLFMAKKFIIAQGGQVIFRSEEGKGSTFGFMLYKAKLAVPAHYESDHTTAKTTTAK